MNKEDLKYINSLRTRVENLARKTNINGKKEAIEYCNTKDNLRVIVEQVEVFFKNNLVKQPEYLQLIDIDDFNLNISKIKNLIRGQNITRYQLLNSIAELKRLLSSLESVSDLIFKLQDVKKINPLFDDKEWEKYYDIRLEKRADQADYYLDIIREQGIIHLDRLTIRKYFKQWFKENHDFDLQIKNGDFAIEEGDIQTVPDFQKKNMPEFVKWFKREGESFLKYLKENGVSMKDVSKEEIINNGNLIINKDSRIQKQQIKELKGEKENSWTKTGVIIAIIVGAFTILGFLLTHFF